MKIHLSLIPGEGLTRSLRLPLAAMTRLCEIIGPQDGEVVADLLMKNREGHVDISGHLHADLRPPCQRCLEPVPLVFDEPLVLTLEPVANYQEGPEEVHLGAGDLEVSFYEDEVLDLRVIVEDELLLLVPELITGEDEQGRCVVCGKRMEELYEQPEEPAADHPFAQMKELLEKE